MRHRYDKSSKWLIDNFAGAILRLAGIDSVESWKPLPGEIVQSRQLPDGLIEVKLEDRQDPVLFLLEINTYPENRVPAELLDDILLTYLNRRVVPEVITLVLCPKGRVRIAPSIELTSPLNQARLSASWLVVNAWEINASDFLPLQDPGLAPWIPLTHINGPVEPVLQQCRDIIDTMTTDSIHANLLAVSQILANLVYDADFLTTFFWRNGKMIESPILQKWIAEANLNKQHEIIAKLLEEQFAPLPPEIIASIKLVTDEIELRQINRAAARCDSLDEFRAVLTTLIPQNQ